MKKPKVAFICVHNSCRSQIAEAFSHLLADDCFEAYSGGTEENEFINPDATRLMNDMYHYDMEKFQSSKLLTTLPEVDIVVKMGCNVVCPFVPSKHEEDWGLDDPSGKSDEEFLKTIEIIKEKVLDLKQRIEINLL